MSRLLAALGVGVVLAACTPGGAPSQQAVRQPAPTVTPTPNLTPTPTEAPTARRTPAPSPTPATWERGLVAYPVGSSQSPLPYIEYLPPGYGDGKPRPLLVFLHGVDEDANGNEASLRKILGLGIPQMIAEGRWPSDRQLVVLMPQEPAAKSNACDFAPEIDQFLDYAIDRYKVDASRIYLTGISCGAIGVLDYLANSRERLVAATVPIASAPYESADVGARVRGGCAIARTPTWFFHGALDEIVPVHYIDDAVAEQRACDPPPSELKLTIYPNGHHDDDTWGRTYDGSAGYDIYGWLLKHKLD